MGIKISEESLKPVFDFEVLDENNQNRWISVVGENPLIIKIDDKEIVTLMTLGNYPEALVLGYLRNQRLIKSIDDLISIDVNWQTETANVITKNGIENLNKKISKRVVTTGCGQGTVFSCTMDEIYNQKLPNTKIKKSEIYQILNLIQNHNQVYKIAGAVHSCALCQKDKVLLAVEDVGRHNAADAISGLIWLNDIKNIDDLIFYTTGRITSEIVMKVAQMGIAVLLSRSGVTQMGLELATELNMLVIARAKGKHFLVYSEFTRLIFD